MSQRFEYTAFDEAGNKKNGEIEALSDEEAVRKLIEKGLQPSSVKHLREGFSLTFKRKPGLKELEYFTKEMSLLLDSGIRIDKAIGIIARNNGHPEFAKLLTDVHTKIKQGIALNQALAEYPELFSTLYINMVAIGEASGNLPNVFASLSDDLAFKTEIKKKTLQALTYPSVILVVCVLCLYFVFTFIVPQMSGIFENVATLPWYTEVILAISGWLIANEFLFFIAIGVFIGVISWLKSRGELDAFFQPVLLKAPVLKTLTKLLESMRFNASMALMLSSGVRLDNALSLAVGSIKHPYYKNAVKKASDSIRKGSALASTLAETNIYDDIYKSLLEVGEESGRLEQSFQEIAQRQKRGFEDWTSKMTALLEPLLIVFMGLVVGGVVVVMLLSMVTVNDVSF